jgi:hypothetical protein
VLRDVDTILGSIRLRSHDPDVKFVWVQSGIESLHMIKAKDTPGVLHSLVMAVGTYPRGRMTADKVREFQKAIYMFGCMLRNMRMKNHTEEEVNVRVQ